MDDGSRNGRGFASSGTGHAGMFGPTTGDRMRLADTELILQVEEDRTISGDEVKFGGGKVIRDGMGQDARASRAAGAPDLVITNALIVDYTGIYKADIAVRDGLISGIGKAGNPGLQDGVDAALVIGPGTEVVAGEGMICTAGGIDSHIHFICPQLIETALTSGVTTLLGGGTGPAHGTLATTCTPGAWNLARMLEAAEAYPVNLGFFGKGNGSLPEPLREQVAAGACGLKLHEDWGTTPAAIDCCLGVADESDVQVAIHTDTLNEAGFVEDTIRAFRGRTIHTFHSEGAGGGHAPDILRVCGEANVLPSSTNPTRPFTVNTVAEHRDMLMVCHHLDPAIPEDVAFADSRIRPQTIAAEDILHDLGAISIMASDSQAMGRVGEVITRTWQTAHKMKVQRGALAGDSAAHDNARIKRYVAKYTICPAVAHGVNSLIGSVEVGKLADLTPLAAGVLRRAPGTGHQGRIHCIRRHGRRQRLHSHSGAGVGTANVRRPRCGTGIHQCYLPQRRGGRAGRLRQPGATAAAAGAGARHARAAQDRPAAQRCPAGDGGGSRLLQRACRRRAAGVRTTRRGAAGAALLPVLKVRRSQVGRRHCGRLVVPRALPAVPRYLDRMQQCGGYISLRVAPVSGAVWQSVHESAVRHSR